MPTMRLPLFAWSGLLTTLAVCVIMSITLPITLTITSNVILSATSAHVEARLDSTLFAIQHVIRRPIVFSKIFLNASRVIASVNRKKNLSSWNNRSTRHFAVLSADMSRVPWLDVTNVLWIMASDASRFASSVRSVASPTDLVTIVEEALNGNPITHTAYNLTSVTPILNISAPEFASQFSLTSNQPTATLIEGTRVYTNNGTISIWSNPNIFSAGFAEGGAPLVQYGISLDACLRSNDGTIIGYVFTTASLQAMSEILLKFVLTVPGGASVLLDAFGFLMASSLADSIGFVNITFVPVGTQRSPLLGCDTINAQIWGLATTSSSNTSQVQSCRSHMSVYPFAPLNALARAAPSFPFANTVQSTHYTMGNGRYFAAAQRVATQYANLNLFLVVMMPENELAGDVTASRNLAIGVVIGIVIALLAATAAGLFWMLHPLRRLANELQENTLSGMIDIAERDSSTVQVSELSPVVLSHRAMATELQRIRAFVPANTRRAPDGPVPAALMSVTNAANHLLQSDDGNAHHQTMAMRNSPSMLRQRYHTSPHVEAASGSVTDSQSSIFQRKSCRSVRFATTERFSVGDVSVTPQSLVCVFFGNPAAVAPGGTSTSDAAGCIERATQLILGRLHVVAVQLGGTLRPFLGDHVVIEFRDSAKAPLITACQAAMRLLKDNLMCALGEWTVAVEAGLGMVGAVGNAAMSTMHVIGKNYEVYQLARLARVYRRRSVFMSARNLDRFTAELLLQPTAENCTWGIRRVDAIDLASLSHFGPTNMRQIHPAEIHPIGVEADHDDEPSYRVVLDLRDRLLSALLTEPKDHREVEGNFRELYPAEIHHAPMNDNDDVAESSCRAVFELRERLINLLTSTAIDRGEVESIQRCLRSAVDEDLTMLDSIDVREYFRVTDIPAFQQFALPRGRLPTEDAIRLLRRVVPRFPMTRDLL